MVRSLYMYRTRIAVALLTFAAVLFAQESSERRYEGKPAEHWIENPRSADLSVRRRAAYALWHLAPTKNTLPALAIALGEEDKYVRETASKTLRKYGPEVRVIGVRIDIR
jgi:HEAT repeat protein